MSWSGATLSTTTSIAKIESEVNNLTSTNWNDKIALAKELIGDRLEVILTNRGYKVDELDSEVLLDIISNPTVFNISSDYLVLSLTFEDLSQGSDGLYKSKAEKYLAYFEQKFDEDIRRITLDTDLDDTTDTTRMDWQGKLER